MKQSLLILAALLGFNLSALAQDRILVDKEDHEEQVLVTAELQHAEYPGGIASLAYYMEKNLKIPAFLGKKKKRPVVISFIVERDGRIDSIQFVQRVCPRMDAAAFALVHGFPRFSPAKIKYSGYLSNKPLRERITIPVSFQRKKIRETLLQAYSQEPIQTAP
jgi:hypothetical protein